MQIEFETIEDSIIKISLAGRLDMQGNQDIEMKFTAQAATERAGILVDMAGVEFLASIGIRTLITNAKSQAKRGGKLVLCSAQPLVKDVLTTSGVDTIIDIFDNCDAAVAELKRLEL